MAWFGPRGEAPLITEREAPLITDRYLIIPRIMRSMAGQYKCTVFEDLEHSKSSYVTVTVQCKSRGKVKGKKGGREEETGGTGRKRERNMKKEKGTWNERIELTKNKRNGEEGNLVVTYSGALHYCSVLTCMCSMYA